MSGWLLEFAIMRFQQFTVEFDLESDGRWIADIPAIPGCLVYGATRDAALAAVKALAEAVIAERVKAGEPIPTEPEIEQIKVRVA